MGATASLQVNLWAWFVTVCYGQPAGKSVGLVRHCVAPTRQGRQALNNILRGKWPAYIGKNIVDKVPKIPSGVMDKILLE